MYREQESLKAFIGIRRTSENLGKVSKADVQKHQLTINEFGVLELLYHKGCQPVQVITDKILISNSSTTYVIDRLCQKGLVTRRKDAKDGRMFIVGLTDEGQRLISMIFPQHAQTITQAFECLSDEEIFTLRQTLKKLSQHIENNVLK